MVFCEGKKIVRKKFFFRFLSIWFLQKSLARYLIVKLSLVNHVYTVEWKSFNSICKKNGLLVSGFGKNLRSNKLRITVRFVISRPIKNFIRTVRLQISALSAWNSAYIYWNFKKNNFWAQKTKYKESKYITALYIKFIVFLYFLLL